VMPTYMMWFAIQCCAAAERLPAADRQAFLRAVGPRIAGIFDWMSACEKDGLLEDLPGWVFIEWSKANDYAEGVNFPSNMLWAFALERSGRLMERSAWIDKADRVRARVRSLSFDGRVFHDQAHRDKDGRLVRNAKSQTETCQYYAFFTGLATPASDPDLWRLVVDELGPGRKGRSEMEPSDVFFGWLLRLELLAKYRETERLLADMKSYYGKMAKESGTFWEFADGHDSRCHALGSYVAVLLLRTALGVDRIDWADRKIFIAKPGLPEPGMSVKTCAFPVPGGGMFSFAEGASRVPKGWEVIGSPTR